MNFTMNDREYIILEKPKEEMFGSVKEKNEDNGKEYLGLHFPTKSEIWLLNTLTKGQKRKTLYHELMHCYIWCYMNEVNNLNEEDVCNISANSHDIINKIVNDYFKKL